MPSTDLVGTAANDCGDPVSVNGDSLRSHIRVLVNGYGLKNDENYVESAAEVVTAAAVIRSYYDKNECRALTLRPETSEVLATAQEELETALLNVLGLAMNDTVSKAYALQQARIQHMSEIESKFGTARLSPYDGANNTLMSVIPSIDLLTLRAVDIEGEVHLPQFLKKALSIEANWNSEHAEFASQAVGGNTRYAAQSMPDAIRAYLRGTYNERTFITTVVGHIYTAWEQQFPDS